MIDSAMRCRKMQNSRRSFVDLTPPPRHLAVAHVRGFSFAAGFMALSPGGLSGDCGVLPVLLDAD